MGNIVAVLRNMPDYIGSSGRSSEEIELAEKELECTFFKDYRKYLEEIGLACFNGHELTGLTKEKRLDVVSVTKKQRELFGKNTFPWYVIEEANIYGIVIWQSPDGTVYATTPNSKPKKIANSLLEYIISE